MNVTVTGRHMELTDALRSYVENSLGKIAHHFHQDIDGAVVLSVQKHRHIAEVNVNANGLRIHSTEASGDMYASVDALMEKLEKRIGKYRDRINSHKPRTGKELPDFGHAIIEMGEQPGNNGAEGAPIVGHHVVRREKLPMTPLNVEEAVMQLELASEPPFLVFSNADTSQINVLYAREDGTFGLIEPEF